MGVHSLSASAKERRKEGGMLGGLCHFYGRGGRSAAIAAPLASSGLARCETVIHGYGASPLEGVGGTNL